MIEPHHTTRTVEWGNWGITFMDPQPDQTKNYGVIIGTVYFPVGTRGPMDGGAARLRYRQMCDAWIEKRTTPEGLQPFKL